MRSLAKGTSAEKVLDFTVYISSRLAADPEVAALAAPIDAADKAFRTRLGQRNSAADAVTRKRAVRDHHLRAIGAAIRALAFEAAHHFHGAGAKGYTDLFPVAPSRLAGTPEKNRAAEFDGLLTRAQAVASVASLKPLVKTFSEAWTRLQGAQTALDAGLVEHGKAGEVVLEAKEAVNVSARQVYGQLLARYADDTERCDSYFPAAPVKAKKKGEPSPTTTAGVTTTKAPR